ncbi:hypothetical protein [Thermomicrobium sp.]
MTAFQRTETRLIRPILTIDEVLADVELRLSPDQPYTRDTLLEVPDENGRGCFPQLRVVLHTEPIDEECPELRDRLLLTVCVSERPIHRSTMVYSSSLDQVPEEIDLYSLDCARDIHWQGVDEIRVYLLLARSDPSALPGRPFRKGHWVAQKRFEIRSKVRSDHFPITLWTRERFERERLPGDTVFWLDLRDETILFEKQAKLDDGLLVAVHADLFRSLSRDRRFQREFAVEVLAEIVYRGLRSLEGEAVPENSYLDRLIERLARKARISRRKLEEAARNDDYSTVRAVVQSAYDLLRELSATMP